ncbi:MAG: hypothetical protein NTW28_18685 [Candidatus Solibacter sp.]|nr:hypothetical protein [Candidatus Solibacter sp.]
MNADDLRRLAVLSGEKPPTRKADMAAVIVRHLAGAGLRGVWEGLDEMQRAAVAEVVHSTAFRFDAKRLRAKYGQDPDWGVAGKYGRGAKPSPLRFFFYGGVMPTDLKQRLKTFVPAPRRTTLAGLERLPPIYVPPSGQPAEDEPEPLTIHETERKAQRELLAVLRLVDAGKLTVSDKTHRPSSAAVVSITAILDGGDYYPHVPPKSGWDDENAGPIRAFAWPLLIQAGKLAQLSGTRLQLTKTGRQALSAPAAKTLRSLWNSWMGTTLLDELARIDCVKGQSGKGKRGLTSVARRRESIAIGLAECPAGAWVSSDDFLRYLTASGNDFTVTRDAWGLYICDQQYGSLGYDGSGPLLDDRYAFCLLLEYAATLGLIDVALIPPADARADFRDMWGTDALPFFSRYDGLMYLRLTPLGAWCLGAESNYQPVAAEDKPLFRVLPSLEIVVVDAELEPADRLALNSYATPVADWVWRLEPLKLLSAIADGRPVSEIREFLEGRGFSAIPDTVEDLLADVALRSTAIRDCGLARLIECADAALAAMLAGEARMRKLCTLVGDRRLVVPVASEAAFLRVLRELGYLVSSGIARPAKTKRPGIELGPTEARDGETPGATEAARQDVGD